MQDFVFSRAPFVQDVGTIRDSARHARKSDEWRVVRAICAAAAIALDRGHPTPRNGRAADAFVSATGQASLRNDAANTDDHEGDEFSGGDRGDEPDGVSAGVPTGGVRVAGAA